VFNNLSIGFFIRILCINQFIIKYFFETQFAVNAKQQKKQSGKEKCQIIEIEPKFFDFVCLRNFFKFILKNKSKIQLLLQAQALVVYDVSVFNATFFYVWLRIL